MLKVSNKTKTKIKWKTWNVPRTKKVSTKSATEIEFSMEKLHLLEGSTRAGARRGVGKVVCVRAKLFTRSFSMCNCQWDTPCARFENAQASEHSWWYPVAVPAHFQRQREIEEDLEQDLEDLEGEHRWVESSAFPGQSPFCCKSSLSIVFVSFTRFYAFPYEPNFAILKIKNNDVSLAISFSSIHFFPQKKKDLKNKKENR